MNVRILSCSLVGGLLSVYTLSFPLYLVLPTSYTSYWNDFSWGWTSFIGYVVTMLVVVCTGYVAARWDWQTTMRGRVNAGALAGLLAAMIAFPLIGAPAAAVASQGPVFLHGIRPAFDDREFIHVVVECVIRAAWYPFLTFWAMFACGTVLGAIGGMIASMDPAAGNWGTAPPARAAASVFDSSIALMFVGALILVTCIVAITTLEYNCDISIAKYGFDPSFPTWGITDCPISITLVLLIVSTWFCGQWCATRWNHPVPGVERAAKLAAVFMAVLPVLTILMVARLRWDILQQWFFLIGEGFWFGVIFFWLLRIRSKRDAEPESSQAPAPAFRDRLILNAGFIGAIIPGLSMATGITQAVALALGIVPYLEAISRANPANVGASSVALASGAPETSPYATAAFLVQARAYKPALGPEQLPNAHALIQDLYAIHIWGTFSMAAIWFIATAIHGWSVIASQAIWKARLAAAQQTAVLQG